MSEAKPLKEPEPWNHLTSSCYDNRRKWIDYGRAVRAQLAEKDREIERLKTDLASADMWAADHSEYVSPEAYAEMAAHANEGWSLLSASQAREREEVEAHLRTIDQRDAAEDALSDAFQLVTGREPEWSNLFGYADAMEEITASLGQKESALAAARKALERIEKEAYELGPEYWGLSDIARAALAPEQKGTT